MDLSEPPRNGAVIRYAYLWRDEKRLGLEEGRKDRPVAVLLAKTEAETGVCTVVVMPITHTPPRDPGITIPVPAADRRTMGLDDEPCWIVCNEVNAFVWPGFDVRPTAGGSPVCGMMPHGLYERIRKLFLELRTAGRAAMVKRD